ncbi:MAG: TonB family protein [Paraglaciecola sp.]|uniref:TonB family protein n=1 Tax=Paraglaciecola sp. TaxID=1920173 RepID=UPI003267E83A
MKKTILIIVATLLFGCSATPNLSTEAIEVQSENLNKHWEMMSKSFSFSSPSNVVKRPKGYVKVRYLIDSNGKVFNPAIVESVPEGVWDDQGLKAVKQMEYKPSESNINRVPVYVTTQFYFGNSV